ncbi:MAG: malectin domain-containing carbohydrate-binding protein [Terracidiphilus sp.]
MATDVVRPTPDSTEENCVHSIGTLTECAIVNDAQNCCLPKNMLKLFVFIMLTYMLHRNSSAFIQVYSENVTWKIQPTPLCCTMDSSIWSGFMDQVPASHAKDSERAELEAVLTALTHTPRLQNYLKYIGDKYFHHRINEINEYNIATEVLGRSKSTFDASRDSIARVEAHRLRKKLKAYYESDGKDHEIQISLPQGSYVPVFNLRPPAALTIPTPEDPGISQVDSLSSAPATGLVLSDSGLTEAQQSGEPARRKQTLRYGMAGLAVLLVVGIGAVLFLAHNKSSHPPVIEVSSPVNATQPGPQNTAPLPLRLLAGYDGSPRIDSAGAYWLSDRYYLGGGAFRRPDTQVIKTSDPMLFDYWRTSDFTYNIPLAQGPYELHLYFVASPQDDPKTSFFHVSANGQMLLSSFNIAADALGANVADERVFKDVYPDKDGFLHLKFFMERSSPTLNALEILPGLPHRQLPVRLVMQRSAVTDHNGNLWHPDNYYQNGTLSDLPRQIEGTPDPNLYAQERYGHFTYSIPVDTHGRYTLVLHFAELYWVPDPASRVGVGSRVFRVYCNGTTLLDNFDIFKEAGSLHALTKTFSHLQPSPEGKLDLTFEPISNYATVSAIEVIDESE